MHSEMRQDGRTVRAELAFSELYRFRIWLAAVLDSAELGMGFRAYHAHIYRSLAVSAKEGVKFLNAAGGNLNTNRLKADDLWGFLGKREAMPYGPKRHIQNEKLCILDIYFKIKNPSLAETFSKADVSSELSYILGAFFERQYKRTHGTVGNVKRLEGVYLPRLDISVPYIRKALKDGRSEVFTIPVLIVRPHVLLDYVDVHKVLLPLRADYIADIRIADGLRRYLAHHSPAATPIYSGIGIPSSGLAPKHLLLSCVLRHRSTYRPHLTDVQVWQSDAVYDSDDLFGNEDDEAILSPHVAFDSPGPMTSAEFTYCYKGDVSARLAGRLGWSDALVGRVHEFYQILGGAV